MRREEVLDIILSTKVIAVIRMSDTGKLARVVEAIKKGGVRAIEITMTTPSALDLIAEMAKRKSAGTVVGAGTVLDAATAEKVIRAGAEFVVSPVTNFDVIAACRRNDTFVAPGAFSPTEIVAAWEKGADVVKVFPATSVGPKYFQDLKGPLPQVRLMPTGGVNVENAREFIRSGACCVAIGTALLDKKAIAAEDWDVLTDKAKALMESLH
ncbi:MAG: 2-dehydro-3-deoxyphosphogluconate aldolase [Candidatus Aminicenantes bacterium RBG_19FT_COMBO_58_17]|jgi:2-dehydro-3-deoxyphosphogluconate aldolase/(4S)-4-hydroxy-2-oxoglutarate aldolase|nr:MAG: 2-dehydro-3-deoxyphosphogluconate aldolase [Candidatus Aminicenantes bacterium RBG_19FT_COMBO_58_17]HCS48553.1 2-dehydro-3-deoxyphosphogluconate aldolase [Candidatus Aminicenantes bacterium]